MYYMESQLNKPDTRNLHKIVHFDLKGAPLKIPYLEQVLLKCKLWGATGFLFEWEDTFPYTGDLADIGSVTNAGGDGMYTMEEVQHIFQLVKDNGMLAIQLVQTIGHMEFVLKHPAFSKYREIDKSPAVLCPTRPGSKELVWKMVSQALDAQPDAKYFHIGADEVWYKAACNGCKKRASEKRFGADELFLEYIQELTSFIMQKRPGLTILMWDDMLRPISAEAIKEYDFNDVQLVYWNYNQAETFPTNPLLWEKYTSLFLQIWVGSAFKGASGSCQLYASAGRYASNHDAWLREMTTYKNNIDFVGIILTGWSRYDHYAALCELLPVMIPSLFSCLTLISNPAQYDRSKVVREVLLQEEWPGEEVARCVHSFIMLRNHCIELINGEKVATWLNPWQIEHGYTVYTHVESIAESASCLQEQVRMVKEVLANNLHAITGRRSAEEWLTTYIEPIYTKISAIATAANTAMERVAGVRP